MVDVVSKMMANVLEKFEGAGYSLNFTSDFEVLKMTPESVHGAGLSSHHSKALFTKKHTRLQLTTGQSCCNYWDTSATEVFS